MSSTHVRSTRPARHVPDSPLRTPIAFALGTLVAVSGWGASDLAFAGQVEARESSVASGAPLLLAAPAIQAASLEAAPTLPIGPPAQFFVGAGPCGPAPGEEPGAGAVPDDPEIEPVPHDPVIEAAPVTPGDTREFRHRRKWGKYPPRERERSRAYQGPREPQGWLTLRGGFFDGQETPENDWTIGLKATGRAAPQLRIGLSADLQRRSEHDQERLEEFRDESGNIVRSTVTTFAASSNLVPILGILEYEVPSPGIRPYVGVGAGYEVLVVEVEDFEQGERFTDTFGGFGWQAWGGVAVPVGRYAALTGEVFLNRGTVERDVRDFDSGAKVHEEIDVDGEGLRAGVRFAF